MKRRIVWRRIKVRIHAYLLERAVLLVGGTRVSAVSHDGVGLPGARFIFLPHRLGLHRYGVRSVDAIGENGGGKVCCLLVARTAPHVSSAGALCQGEQLPMRRYYPRFILDKSIRQVCARPGYCPLSSWRS